MRFNLLSAEGTTGAFAEFFSKYGMLIIIAVMLVLLYFVMWRPQRKQEKETAKTRHSMRSGRIERYVVHLNPKSFVCAVVRHRFATAFSRALVRNIAQVFPVVKRKKIFFVCFPVKGISIDSGGWIFSR